MLAGAEVPLYLNDTSCFKLITEADVNEKNAIGRTGTREDSHDRGSECACVCGLGQGVGGRGG